MRDLFPKKKGLSYAWYPAFQPRQQPFFQRQWRVKKTHSGPVAVARAGRSSILRARSADACEQKGRGFVVGVSRHQPCLRRRA